MGRQPLGVNNFEQRAERLAALAVDRDPIALPQARRVGAGVPRRGERLQVRVQAGGARVREVDGDPGGAIPQPLADQARPAFRAALFRGELLGLVLLTDLRGDDVQDPPPQDPQLPRTEIRGMRDQMSLRVVEHLGRKLLGRQLVEGVRDHLRLSNVQVAGTQAGGHTGPAPVHRLSQRQVTPVGAVITARLVSHQSRDIAYALSQSNVVGDRHHPQPKRAQLRLQPGQLHQRRPLVRGHHEHHLDVDGVLQCGPDRLGTREDRMHVAVESRAHSAPPVSTTDQWDWFSRVDAACL